MLDADRIEVLRKEYYTSRDDFATALGISERSYSRYLRGEISPPVNVVIRMASLLDTTVAYLLGETAERKRVVLVSELSGNRQALLEAKKQGIDIEAIKSFVAFLEGKD